MPQHPPIGPRDVASILARALREKPEAEALSDETSRYSYAALDRAIDGVLAHLHRAGIKPGDRVAASLPNGCDIVIAFMATQRLGAIWVGINQILSPPEMHRILSHAEVRYLFTDSRIAQAIDTKIPRLILDDPEHAALWAACLAGENTRNLPEAAIDPFAPAVLMYTSGTSGIPKGVIHSQHNLVTVCAAAAYFNHMRPNGRRGVILPLTIANLMILGPLMAFWNGASCACGKTAPAPALAAWFAREKIETCSGVPTIVYDLLKSDTDLPSCLQLMAGGAPLPFPLRAAFLQRYGYPLVGTYGLTEAPTVVAETRNQEPPPGASGLPMPHMRLTIRNEAGDILPPGDIGEICVGPTQEGEWANIYTPALGYWNDPVKSAKLLKNGVLHTGDLGSLNAEGWLFVADRGSELILRAGSNIYPAEIEAVLQSHGQVAGCAIIGQPDDRLGARTIAFVQPDSGADQDALKTSLLALCQRELARYKHPDIWVFIEQLPRNAMGKVSKAELRHVAQQHWPHGTQS